MTPPPEERYVVVPNGEQEWSREATFAAARAQALAIYEDCDGVDVFGLHRDGRRLSRVLIVKPDGTELRTSSTGPWQKGDP